MEESSRLFKYVSSKQFPLQDVGFVGVVFASSLEVKNEVLAKITEEWYSSCKTLQRRVGRVEFKDSLLFIDVAEDNHCQNYGGMCISSIVYSREAERKVEDINHREYMKCRLRSPCKIIHNMVMV